MPLLVCRACCSGGEPGNTDVFTEKAAEAERKD